MRTAALWISAFVALLLQTFLPVKIPMARLFDFPLLVTIYFALARRSKVFGTLLGTVLGLVQDELSHGWVGMAGMSKALVGYLAASASYKFDFERTVARLLVTGLCVLIHNLFYAGLEHLLLDSPPAFRPLDLASSVLINVAVALLLFRLLDHFNQPA